ncbi:hypothetical protein B0H14DRAFT_2676308 [Mycena olivaceomarginata]|nr:hypothetical protein B0H14DRAFT_2676308 [Mycena olivaceomarginata]
MEHRRDLVSSLGTQLYGQEESILDPPGRPARTRHSRKQPAGHIPRPPNAFILFRSSFIRSQRISADVEQSPRTLSKIVGLTWQNLPADERRVWHAKARQEVEAHRRRFPEYSFRPAHRRAAAKTRDRRHRVDGAVVDNPERCAKIAELLVEGTHGRALDAAMQEFDQQREPSFITRFEPPVTATSYRRASSAPAPDTEAPTSFMSSTPNVAQRRRSSSSGPSSRSRKTDAPINDQSIPPEIASVQTSAIDMFISPPKSSFCDFNTFSFVPDIRSAYSDFTCDPLSSWGAQDPAMCNNSGHSPANEFDFGFNANRGAPELSTRPLIAGECARDMHPLAQLPYFNHGFATPMAAYSSDFNASSAYAEPNIAPELSQIESDFINLMAEYCLDSARM